MESALISKLQAGEEQAFKELVESYQDKVINTCYGFLHNREDAEDAAQDVFIEVYRSIGAFREEARLSSWIYRIAVSKALDALRRNKRKKRLAFFQNILIPDKKEVNDAQSTEATPQENLEQKERARVLKQAVDALPENQRVAITLNKYEGFSYLDIAEIMGTSLSAVESLIHRAKKNLQKKLLRYYERNL